MNKTSSAASGTTKPASQNPPDIFREYVESIAMAIILALVFRNFVAEAFVIPTGSMAPTLTGRHKDVQCPQCQHWYQTGASNEAAQDGSPTGTHVIGTTCPMCRFPQTLDVVNKPNDGSFSGDRIIVSKFSYDFSEPKRWDVIVFKYPGNARDNYIKRLVGLPNERIRIVGGNVYARAMGEKEFRICRKPPEKLNVLLQLVHDTEYLAKDLNRLRWPTFWYDPAATAEKASRWQTSTDGKQHLLKTSDELTWLRYRHVMPDIVDWSDLVLKDRLPEGVEVGMGGLVTDMYAYNSGYWLYTGKSQMTADAINPEIPLFEQRSRESHPEAQGMHWVDDLAVQAEVDIQSDRGELTAEIVRAGIHYQAFIDVATGQAKLKMVGPDQQPIPFRGADGKQTAEPQGITPIRGMGTYTLRLSNVDHELLLWVNGKVISFDGPTTYDSPELVQPYWTAEDPGDTSPAAIGGRGISLGLQRLQIYRDKYYIATSNELHQEDDDYQAPLSEFPRDEANRIAQILYDPALWKTTPLFSSRRAVEFEVPADCFFPMGDNSPYSKDARLWAEPYRNSPVPPYGLAPVPAYVRRDLLVGKALMVYLPHTWNSPYFWPSFRRFGWIR